MKKLKSFARKPQFGHKLTWPNDCNKAVSTYSGYEAMLHAIPLDVLSSIAMLFGISADELLGLEKSDSLSLSGLEPAQKIILEDLRREFLAPSQRGKDFSPQQMKILHDIIKAFS